MALPRVSPRHFNLRTTQARRFKLPWRKERRLTISRSSSMRIQLALFGWFLREKLPEAHPEIFPPETTVAPCPNQGWSNLAFVATVPSGERYMVRMRAESSLETPDLSPYHKESWILKNLPATVPHAAVFANGIGHVKNQTTDAPYSWFVQSYLPYFGADQPRSSIDPIEFRKRLGSIARSINNVSCRGFGTKFSLASNSFQKSSWKELIQSEVEQAGFNAAVTAGFLSLAGSACLQKRIRSLEQLAFTPCLYHVDFAENWSNVLIDNHGSIRAIIDWEMAGSGPALHFEFANTLYVMMRDGRSKREIARNFEAFLSGYGITFNEYREFYAHDVETLILLLAVQKLRRYIDLDQQGKLREHRWRVEFFERCGELVQLGARLSECENRKILFTV